MTYVMNVKKIQLACFSMKRATVVTSVCGIEGKYPSALSNERRKTSVITAPYNRATAQ
jgi:hypothetical protein